MARDRRRGFDAALAAGFRAGGRVFLTGALARLTADAGRFLARAAGIGLAAAVDWVAVFRARTGLVAAFGRLFAWDLTFGLAADLAFRDFVADRCFDGFFRVAIISSSDKVPAPIFGRRSIWRQPRASKASRFGSLRLEKERIQGGLTVSRR